VAAIYVPENWLGNDGGQYSRTFDLLPEQDILPDDLMQVASFTASNQTVADGSPDPEAMLKRLENWGREISVTRVYMPVERCRTAGVRSLRMSAVKLQNFRGAQAYYEVIRQQDQEEGANPQVVEVGWAGYWFQQAVPSPCLENDQNLLVGVVFMRDNVIGTVYIQAAKARARSGEMLRLALKVARKFDERIMASASQ
jgi:hypothetical protein